MELGQPQRLLDKVQGDNFERTRLEEGENNHRILFGPVKVAQIYYPSLVKDPETQELKQKMKVITRPDSGSPLDSLASLDERIRRTRGEERPRSSLRPSSKWLYLVIDKNSKEYPKVTIAEYPFTVYDQITKLEQSVSNKNPDKLRYGLIFMWDAIITKTVDKSKPKQYGTSYNVEVDPENPYAGKIPRGYLGRTSAELAKHGVNVEQFFTEEELKAIKDSDFDLEKIAAPDTWDQMLEKLNKFPIYLGASDRGGHPRFPQLEEFVTQAQESNIPFLSGDAQAAEGDLTPTSRRIEGPKVAGDDNFQSVEDGEFQEVEKPAKKPVQEAPKEEPKAAKAEEQETKEKPKASKEKEPTPDLGGEDDKEFPNW